MTRLELAGVVVGFLCIVAAFVAVDWRLGLAVFGFGLTASSFDVRRPS